MKNLLITRNNYVAVPGEHIFERQSLASDPVSQSKSAAIKCDESLFDTCEGILIGSFENC